MGMEFDETQRRTVWQALKSLSQSFGSETPDLRLSRQYLMSGGTLAETVLEETNDDDDDHTGLPASDQEGGDKSATWTQADLHSKATCWMNEAAGSPTPISIDSRTVFTADSKLCSDSSCWYNQSAGYAATDTATSQQPVSPITNHHHLTDDVSKRDQDKAPAFANKLPSPSLPRMSQESLGASDLCRVHSMTSTVSHFSSKLSPCTSPRTTTPASHRKLGFKNLLSRTKHATESGESILPSPHAPNSPLGNSSKTHGLSNWFKSGSSYTGRTRLQAFLGVAAEAAVSPRGPANVDALVSPRLIAASGSAAKTEAGKGPKEPKGPKGPNQPGLGQYAEQLQNANVAKANTSAPSSTVGVYCLKCSTRVTEEECAKVHKRVLKVLIQNNIHMAAARTQCLHELDVTQNALELMTQALGEIRDLRSDKQRLVAENKLLQAEVKELQAFQKIITEYTPKILGGDPSDLSNATPTKPAKARSTSEVLTTLMKSHESALGSALEVKDLQAALDIAKKDYEDAKKVADTREFEAMEAKQQLQQATAMRNTLAAIVAHQIEAGGLVVMNEGSGEVLLKLLRRFKTGDEGDLEQSSLLMGASDKPAGGSADSKPKPANPPLLHIPVTLPSAACVMEKVLYLDEGTRSSVQDSRPQSVRVRFCIPDPEEADDLGEMKCFGSGPAGRGRYQTDSSTSSASMDAASTKDSNVAVSIDWAAEQARGSKDAPENRDQLLQENTSKLLDRLQQVKGRMGSHVALQPNAPPKSRSSASSSMTDSQGTPRLFPGMAPNFERDVPEGYVDGQEGGRGGIPRHGRKGSGSGSLGVSSGEHDHLATLQYGIASVGSSVATSGGEKAGRVMKHGYGQGSVESEGEFQFGGERLPADGPSSSSGSADQGGSQGYNPGEWRGTGAAVRSSPRQSPESQGSAPNVTYSAGNSRTNSPQSYKLDPESFIHDDEEEDVEGTAGHGSGVPGDAYQRRAGERAAGQVGREAGGRTAGDEGHRLHERVPGEAQLPNSEPTTPHGSHSLHDAEMGAKAPHTFPIKGQRRVNYDMDTSLDSSNSHMPYRDGSDSGIPGGGQGKAMNADAGYRRHGRTHSDDDLLRDASPLVGSVQSMPRPTSSLSPSGHVIPHDVYGTGYSIDRSMAGSVVNQSISELSDISDSSGYYYPPHGAVSSSVQSSPVKHGKHAGKDMQGQAGMYSNGLYDLGASQESIQSQGRPTFRQRNSSSRGSNAASSSVAVPPSLDTVPEHQPLEDVSHGDGSMPAGKWRGPGTSPGMHINDLFGMSMSQESLHNAGIQQSLNRPPATSAHAGSRGGSSVQSAAHGAGGNQKHTKGQAGQGDMPGAVQGGAGSNPSWQMNEMWGANMSQDSMDSRSLAHGGYPANQSLTPDAKRRVNSSMSSMSTSIDSDGPVGAGGSVRPSGPNWQVNDAWGTHASQDSVSASGFTSGFTSPAGRVQRMNGAGKGLQDTWGSSDSASGDSMDNSSSKRSNRDRGGPAWQVNDAWGMTGSQDSGYGHQSTGNWAPNTRQDGASGTVDDAAGSRRDDRRVGGNGERGPVAQAGREWYLNEAWGVTASQDSAHTATAGLPGTHQKVDSVAASQQSLPEGAVLPSKRAGPSWQMNEAWGMTASQDSAHTSSQAGPMQFKAGTSASPGQQLKGNAAGRDLVTSGSEVPGVRGGANWHMNEAWGVTASQDSAQTDLRAPCQRGVAQHGQRQNAGQQISKGVGTSTQSTDSLNAHDVLPGVSPGRQSGPAWQMNEAWGMTASQDSAQADRAAAGVSGKQVRFGPTCGSVADSQQSIPEGVAPPPKRAGPAWQMNEAWGMTASQDSAHTANASLPGPHQKVGSTADSQQSLPESLALAPERAGPAWQMNEAWGMTASQDSAARESAAAGLPSMARQRVGRADSSIADSQQSMADGLALPPKPAGPAWQMNEAWGITASQDSAAAATASLPGTHQKVGSVADSQQSVPEGTALAPKRSGPAWQMNEAWGMTASQDSAHTATASLPGTHQKGGSVADSQQSLPEGMAVPPKRAGPAWQMNEAWGMTASQDSAHTATTSLPGTHQKPGSVADSQQSLPEGTALPPKRAGPAWQMNEAWGMTASQDSAQTDTLNAQQRSQQGPPGSHHESPPQPSSSAAIPRPQKRTGPSWQLNEAWGMTASQDSAHTDRGSTQKLPTHKPGAHAGLPVTDSQQSLSDGMAPPSKKSGPAWHINEAWGMTASQDSVQTDTQGGNGRSVQEGANGKKQHQVNQHLLPGAQSTDSLSSSAMLPPRKPGPSWHMNEAWGTAASQDSLGGSQVFNHHLHSPSGRNGMRATQQSANSEGPTSSSSHGASLRSSVKRKAGAMHVNEMFGVQASVDSEGPSPWDHLDGKQPRHAAPIQVSSDGAEAVHQTASPKPPPARRPGPQMHVNEIFGVGMSQDSVQTSQSMDSVGFRAGGPSPGGMSPSHKPSNIWQQRRAPVEDSNESFQAALSQGKQTTGAVHVNDMCGMHMSQDSAGTACDQAWPGANFPPHLTKPSGVQASDASFDSKLSAASVMIYPADVVKRPLVVTNDAFGVDISQDCSSPGVQSNAVAQDTGVRASTATTTSSDSIPAAGKAVVPKSAKSTTEQDQSAIYTNDMYGLSMSQDSSVKDTVSQREVDTGPHHEVVGPASVSSHGRGDVGMTPTNTPSSAQRRRPAANEIKSGLNALLGGADSSDDSDSSGLNQTHVYNGRRQWGSPSATIPSTTRGHLNAVSNFTGPIVAPKQFGLSPTLNTDDIDGMNLDKIKSTTSSFGKPRRHSQPQHAARSASSSDPGRDERREDSESVAMDSALSGNASSNALYTTATSGQDSAKRFWFKTSEGENDITPQKDQGHVNCSDDSDSGSPRLESLERLPPIPEHSGTSKQKRKAQDLQMSHAISIDDSDTLSDVSSLRDSTANMVTSALQRSAFKAYTNPMAKASLARSLAADSARSSLTAPDSDGGIIRQSVDPAMQDDALSTAPSKWNPLYSSADVKGNPLFGMRNSTASTATTGGTDPSFGTFKRGSNGSDTRESSLPPRNNLPSPVWNKPVLLGTSQSFEAKPGAQWVPTPSGQWVPTGAKPGSASNSPTSKAGAVGNEWEVTGTWNPLATQPAGRLSVEGQGTKELEKLMTPDVLHLKPKDQLSPFKFTATPQRNGGGQTISATLTSP